MRLLSTRTGVVVPGGIGALAVVCVVGLGLVNLAGESIREFTTALYAEFQAPGATTEELDSEQETSLARAEINTQIINDLIAGHLSPAETVELKMRANQDNIGMWNYLRVEYADAGDDRERMARSIVECVDSFARSNPTSGVDALARVRAELKTMTGHSSSRASSSIAPE